MKKIPGVTSGFGWFGWRIALVVLAISLTGCTSTNLMRSEYGTEPCKIANATQIRNSCENSEHIEVHDAANPSNSYSLQFVEINDQGFFHNRLQADRAIEFAERKPRHGKERLYYVVYVHGWFHGAKMSDDHLPNFLAALESLSRWRPNGEVRGIYIGWRGNSLDVPLLKYLTFWDRKNTSEEVGRGSLHEFLLQLESAIRRNGTQNKLVTIGHSFGASVVFNSLSHTLVQRFLDGVLLPANSHPSIDGPRGYGDLVVLLNPAFEAMRFVPIYSMVKSFNAPKKDEAPPRIARSSKSVRPYFVVLSSEGDWATRFAFPTGRFFSTIWETHPEIHVSGLGTERYSSWNLDRDTIGNFKQFASFEKLERTSGNAATWNSATPCPRPQDDIWAKLSVSRSTEGSSSPEFPGTAFVLKNSSGDGNSPFLLAAVDASIIKDHSDIGKDDLACWFVQLADD